MFDATTLAMRKGCFDDSCDGGHCSVCGCHVVGSDWMSGKTFVCSSCELLTLQERDEVRRARSALIELLYGRNTALSDAMWGVIQQVKDAGKARAKA